MKTYAFLIAMMFLALYTIATPLGWAPTSNSCVSDASECIDGNHIVTTAIPEPSTMALMAIGIGGATLIRRRKNQK